MESEAALTNGVGEGALWTPVWQLLGTVVFMLPVKKTLLILQAWMMDVHGAMSWSFSRNSLLIPCMNGCYARLSMGYHKPERDGT